MDLPQRVADELGIDRSVAQQGISALLMSIRMSVDPKTFDQISAALPNLEDWMRGIQLAGGRTGEIVALGSPEALGRQLKLAGFNEQQALQLGASVGKALAEVLPKDVFEKVAGRVKFLKG